MSELESLDKIKEAEARASQTVERASQTKAKIINDAKKQAIDLVEGALDKSNKFREGRLKATKEKLDEEKAARIEENEKALSSIQKLATSDKFKKQVDSLVKKFYEMI
ncbi:hypothetical protein EPN87_01120 [archaeon]|nr:MAG: hypothetical protein EPN87_01120 [archaeon]